MSGQKGIKNTKTGQFWRVFENLRLIFNSTKIGEKYQIRKFEMRHFESFSNNLLQSETFAVAGLATATPRDSVKPAIVDGKEDTASKNSVATASKSRSKTSTIRPKRAASTRRKLPPVKKSEPTPNDTTNTNERK